MGVFLGNPVVAAEWQLLATLNPSAVTTISSGALAAYSTYRVLAEITLAATETLILQFNGDTANNYRSNGWISSGTTPTFVGGLVNPGCQICLMTATGTASFEMAINGVAPANGVLTTSQQVSMINLGQTCFLASMWNVAASTQISSMVFTTLIGATNFSGKILIYGRSDV